MLDDSRLSLRAGVEPFDSALIPAMPTRLRGLHPHLFVVQSLQSASFVWCMAKFPPPGVLENGLPDSWM